jgi:hypothetical protein
MLASQRLDPRELNSLPSYWTPVSTGVTARNQFFHTLGEGRVGVYILAL